MTAEMRVPSSPSVCRDCEAIEDAYVVAQASSALACWQAGQLASLTACR